MKRLSVLRSEMLEHGCSVSELAKVCGISRSSLYRRFSGETCFTLGEILACCERLSLSAEKRRLIFFS